MVHHHKPTKTRQLRSLQIHSLHFPPPSRIHKVDSVAGATGTSILEFPGRHILVPPWAAIVVYSTILALLILTGAGFMLSYKARQEFRKRLEEESTNHDRQIKSNQDLKSFTRQSIILLNSNRNPSTYAPPFRVSRAGLPMPNNVFERTNRYSIVVAQVVPELGMSSDEVYRFTQSNNRTSFWSELRKSHATSTTAYQIEMLSAQDPNSMTELTEVINGVTWGTERKNEVMISRTKPTQNLAISDHPPKTSTSLRKTNSNTVPSVGRKLSKKWLNKNCPSSTASELNEFPLELSPRKLSDTASNDVELPIKTLSDPDQAMATYAARRTPSPARISDMQLLPSSDSTDPDLAMASYAARRNTPSPINGLRILAQFDSTGLNSSAIINHQEPTDSSPTSIPDTLKVITTKSSNHMGTPIKTSPDPDQAMATYAAKRAPSPARTSDMQLFPSSDSTDPDLAMASYAARRSTPSPVNGLRVLAQFDSTGLNQSAMINQESTVSSPISTNDTLKVWDDNNIQPNRSRTSPALPLIPEHDLQQLLLHRSKSKTNRSRTPTKFGKTLPNRPDVSLLSKSLSTRELTRKRSHPQIATLDTPIPQSRRSNSMSEIDRSSYFTLVDQSNTSNEPSFGNTYTEIVKPILGNIPKINEPSFLNSNGPVRRPPLRMPLSGTMSSGGVRNSSFVR